MNLHRLPTATAVRLAPILALGLLFPTLAAPATAQDPVQRQIQQRTGQQMSQEDILSRLEASGMSRSQVRSRLVQMGMDPSLADPYFDRIEGGSNELPPTSNSFVQALTRMGLVGPLGRQTPGIPDSLRGMGLDTLPDSVRMRLLADTAPEEGPRIFGREMFRRHTTQFSPVLTGPVPSNYRLGPGDELSLVLTGDVELGYTLQVSREGSIVIPDVGQIFVNGLTLEGLENRLYARLGQVYSGVRRGPDATTHFQVSMGRLRVNQVFVVGEVELPGAHEVSALGTVLTALYRAGGPTESGSLRDIRVRRAGEIVASVDLYDYLLEGDTRNDIRLQQGDIVFVPLSGPRVRVQGEVPRPAIFEVQPGEGLLDVLTFAGGPDPEADLERVRIDRILPPGERTAERTRVLSDVDVVELARGELEYPLLDGDQIRVDSIGTEQRDMVVVQGPVYRPGAFEFRPGTTAWDIIQRAGGLRPTAFRPVAHLMRLNPADSTYTLLRLSLEVDDQGQPVDNLLLQDQDSLRIFGEATLHTPREVQIVGEVKEPGRYPLAEGMSVEDLILRAGGFTDRAQGMEVEVSRLEPDLARNDTLATRYRVGLEGTIPWSVLDRLAQVELGAQEPEGLPDAAEFILRDRDQVFVRPLPGYVVASSVRLLGELQLPGSYAFNVREERLSSFIERAGGLTDDAYAQGTRLVRDSAFVGIDLVEAMARPGSSSDPILQPDDELEVPSYEGTVFVTGDGVAFETRVMYREDMDLDDFLAQAGGTLENADESRITVEYMNGQRAIISDRLFFFNRVPDVRPGSTIRVPLESEGAGTDWGNVISTSISVLSTTATLILAITRL